MDASGGLRVETFEQPVERAVFQALPQFFVSRGKGGESIEERPQVEAGASSDNGRFSARGNFGHSRTGEPRIISGGENVFRFYYVNQMVRNSAALVQRHFCSADIEAFVNLQ
jgi:hypothetical protein